jgi:hypothetical protein
MIIQVILYRFFNPTRLRLEFVNYQQGFINFAAFSNGYYAYWQGIPFMDNSE